MEQTDNIIPTLHPEFAERLSRRNRSEHSAIWNILDSVSDPELPGLSLWDLGVLQNISKTPDGWLIEITLTYSGCPAVGVMKEDICNTLLQSGIEENIRVDILMAPAWNTNMMSPEGRQQLRSLNIAPPVTEQESISCPICNSDNTEVISEFGSTACKALYRCNDCMEPFDYFKTLQ